MLLLWCGSLLPCVLQLHDILSPTSRAAFSDVYIVTDIMDTDLGQVGGQPPYANVDVSPPCQILASGQMLGASHVQFFVHQARVQCAGPL